MQVTVTVDEEIGRKILALISGQDDDDDAPAKKVKKDLEKDKKNKKKKKNKVDEEMLQGLDLEDYCEYSSEKDHKLNDVELRWFTAAFVAHGKETDNKKFKKSSLKKLIGAASLADIDEDDYAETAEKIATYVEENA